MQAKTITVPTLKQISKRKSEPSTAECLVVKSGSHFTLHRSAAYDTDDKCWTITHNNTGLALAHCNILKGARVLHRNADELFTESGIDLKTAADFNSNPVVVAALSQLVVAYRTATMDMG